MAIKKAETYKDFHENRVKHLELIQDAITRMGNNSFQMKSWMLVVATALLGTYANTNNKLLIILAIFPTIIFWYLDAYFLRQERKFRGVYSDVAGISDDPKPIKPFEMPIQLYTEEKYSLGNVFGSATLLTLYVSVIVILLGIYFIL